jgi:AAA family ATP:ADP antiporter
MIKKEKNLSMATPPSSEGPSFSRLRTILWPVQNNELKKFLPMGLMMFLILANYTLLRNTKDTLVVTAPGSGAELISFIKVFDIPMSVLFFFVYAKLSNVLSRPALFYSCLVPFLLFFIAFASFIYPNKDLLHPDAVTIATLIVEHPHFKWIIMLYGIWSYVLFYIVAEFWGSIVISLLFWQFANEITRTEEAKRFYVLFPLLGNIALLVAGTFGEWLSTVSRNVEPGVDPLGTMITYTLTAIVISGLGTIALYAWMNKYVLTNPLYYDKARINPKKSKPTLSLTESLSYLLSSRYLGFIAILLLSYGIVSNFIDIMWKSQVLAYFSHPNDYFEFMSRFSFWNGATTLVLVFLTKGIIRRFGWFIGAIITPFVLLTSSLLFFSFILFQGRLEGFVSLFGVTSLYMAVVIGTVQNVFNKSAKYSFFDPTKEMAYIPLDKELKIKGKAAVDVIGARFGKSGGGFIQSILLTLTAGNLLTIAPYLLGILTVICIAWMGAVRGLSNLYTEKLKEEKKTA